MEQEAANISFITLQNSRAFARLANKQADIQLLPITRVWHDDVCSSTITNNGDQPVQIQEIVLFSAPWQLQPTTAFYGEGFQMLSQTAGTLQEPLAIGGYTDQGHYKLPHTPGMTTVYSLLQLATPAQQVVMAFTSCRRFTGLFRVNTERFEFVLDTESMVLAPGESWELEEFCFMQGSEREPLLSALARKIAVHHPRLTVNSIPTGWCSWYVYGPRITEQHILDNMTAIKQTAPQLTYIQIDDGYAYALGDWLRPSKLFPNGVEAACRVIREKGFEPAMWVAPFIAEQGSYLIKEHPDWFVKDEHGLPLLSDKISFGGWRNGPWYMLDGTHPEAQAYLEQVFRTMREEWGCRYFKLDALTWGALQGGQRYDPAATSIEAYRQGMQALRRGAGEDSFVLGCNAPIWASLGLVQGMRVTGDVRRDWHTLTSIARECFWRNWQHNTLWINDPDCVVLENQAGDNPSMLSEDEFFFHATVISASGGMVLSSDAIANLSEEKRAILHKLLPPTGHAARFDDATYRVGRIACADYKLLYLFNWDDEPQSRTVSLPGSHQVSNYWTGEELGLQQDVLAIERMPPHSARLLVCRERD